eukprot:GFUD01007843.1.p1 GENE.GFUD01007843.1~~GFUD01007843.1.p1  ORF type:complete len:265 (-),score=55.53 GFUD01007843.1:91-885(-)
MRLLLSPVRHYLYRPSPGARAVIYLLLVWLVSIFLFQEISNNFFANIKNPLNQYFVKYAWGWTLLPLSGLLILSSLSRQGTLLNTRSVPVWCRLLVCHAVWYIFAQLLFPSIEEATGVCEVSRLLTKRACRKEGFDWRGFDISGHCFLLTWNNLVIIEETKLVMLSLKGHKVRHSWLDLPIKCIYILLGLLMLLWEVMMFCTCLYFHTTTEKVLGTMCAIIPWLLLYKAVPKLDSVPWLTVTHIQHYTALSALPAASWVLARLD